MDSFRPKADMRDNNKFARFSAASTLRITRTRFHGRATKADISPKNGLPLPPAQRSFAFQDLVAHPSLRGIVMRTLVPHYVRLDRHPHWKPYHGQLMLDAKQTSHVVACHKQQVAICEKGRHG